MLSHLNEAYATLTMLAFAQGVHPYLAYSELCRIVGKLSIFGKDRRIADVPHYDHDDLGPIFYWAKERIIALLDMIKDFEFEMQKFVGVGLGMQVTLQPKWLQSDWKWYVGVLHESLNDAECRELLAPKQLDWKLGSQPEVEILFTLGKPGLRLIPLDRNPRALPVDRNWSYYEVSRDNEAWKDVQATQTLAMRTSPRLDHQPPRVARPSPDHGALQREVRRIGIRSFCRADCSMTPPFAKAVDPIFEHVLVLLDRIDAGEGGSIDAEREKDRILRLFDEAQAKLGESNEWQLAKYGLVCWIDEVLIAAEWPGSTWWNEYSLESSMYNQANATSSSMSRCGPPRN